jgi:hypothetical protein
MVIARLLENLFIAQSPFSKVVQHAVRAKGKEVQKWTSQTAGMLLMLA